MAELQQQLRDALKPAPAPRVIIDITFPPFRTLIDDLTLEVDVIEARVSKSRPETGIITFKSTARNAAGVALCEMTSPIIIGRHTEATR